jgi:hypothetical protein
MPIDPTTPYYVVDLQGGEVVYRTTYANRTRARRWADKKNLEYGAHRYATRYTFTVPKRIK